VTITPPADEQVGHHWLLMRRSLTSGELAYYRCFSLRPVGLPTLVRVAGTRWCVETCFKTSKNATGLDEHQVRRWNSWYRYTTLVMLAHAILTVIAARCRAQPQPADQQLIPLSVNEIRRLFAKMIANALHTITHWLAWSRWRRLHQARAKTSHYRRRDQPEHQPTST
jgi:SRSO17 transposase